MGTIDEKLYHQSMVHLETELTEKLYNQNATTGFDHSGIDPQNVSNFFTTEKVEDNPQDKK